MSPTPDPAADFNQWSRCRVIAVTLPMVLIRSMLRHSVTLGILMIASCAPTPASKPVQEPAIIAAPVVQEQPSQSQAPPKVRTAAPVLEAKVVRTTLGGIRLTGVVFDSRTHQLRVADQSGGPGSRWADSKSAGQSTGGVAAINAGFFTPEGAPLGLVVAGGKKSGALNRVSSLGAGFFMDDGSPALIRRGGNTAGSQVLQSGPFLLEKGKRISGLSTTTSTARSVIGWDGNYGWFLARTAGCSLAELSAALAGKTLGGVKILTVLNLDGGRSSDLWVSSTLASGPVRERPIWNKPVRNFLVLHQKN